MTPLPHTSDDITRRHLDSWAATLAGGRRALEIRGAGARALSDVGGHDAVIWLDAPYRDVPVERLRELAEAGCCLVLGVRGLDGAGAETLAQRIGATVAGEQFLVRGSLIVGPGERPVTVTASVEDDDSPARRALLVANAEPPGNESPAVHVALALAAVHEVQLERLEAAYWSLRRANARLARENLGRHDAAAASVVGPLTTELTALRKQLEIEIEVARRNDEYFQAARAKLDEPHHRAAERLFQMLSRVPGGRALSRKALSAKR